MGSIRIDTKILLLISLLLSGYGSFAVAETAVIVHPDNASKFTQEDIANLYLGKTSRFPNGDNALPLDRPEGSRLRLHFVDVILGRDEAQVKAHWSRLIFTGKGIPPRVIAGDSETKALISRNPDTIGYIDAISVDDSVKVILRF